MKKTTSRRLPIVVGLFALTGGAVFAALSLTGSGAGHAKVAGGSANAPSGRAISTAGRASGLTTSSGPVAIRQVGRGVSPSLRSLAPPSRYSGPVRPAETAERDQEPAAPAGPSTRDGALQARVTGHSPALATSFDGLSDQDNANLNGGNVNIPPDTVGDVGPSNYVEATNVALAVYNKAGAKLAGPVNLKQLWANSGTFCKTHNDGDPIVLYDPLSDRWLVSQFAVTSSVSHECIAVSQTSNPAGTYWVYDILISSTKFADYPKVGVWPDGYYFTFNDYVGTTNSGTTALALSRAPLQNGQNSVGVIWNFAQSANQFGLLPADLDGTTQPPANSPEVLVQQQTNSLGIFEFHPNYATPASSTWVKVANLATAAFDPNMCNYSRACIAQPGTANKIDALTGRLMQRLAYRNIAGSQRMVVVHNVDANSADKAGVRWYELRKGSAWSIFQQGTFSPDSTNRWDGSGAMDKNGDIAVGYSAGSAAVFPSIRFAARVPGDVAGTLEAETSMQAGAGSQLTGTFTGTGPNRWGDYAAMSVDPSNDCTFWYVGQYYSPSSSYNWKTRIGSFKFPSCT